MDIDYCILGNRIREERMNKGLTSDRLSEMIDLSADSLRHIEIGTSRPSLSTLFRIAEQLDVSLDYLTGRSSDPCGFLFGTRFKGLDLDQGQLQLLDKLVSEMLPIVINHL